MWSLASSTFAICILLESAVGLGAASAASGATVKSSSASESRHGHSGAVRVYVMNGLFGELITNAMNQIGDKLRARGAIVQVGSWVEESSFVADACAHRGDRVVFIGHSMGAVAAAGAVSQAKACGVRRVSMVGVDPPATGSVVSRGAHAVNFVGALDAPIKGARNVPVTGHNHIAIVNDPVMQKRIVTEALH
jgi:pimeloyl-ACP methyl ester carboxylesterase